jgi:hypothetical protein
MLKQLKFILTVLETGKPKLGCHKVGSGEERVLALIFS